jgi:hypothetical protein
MPAREYSVHGNTTDARAHRRQTRARLHGRIRILLTYGNRQTHGRRSFGLGRCRGTATAKSIGRFITAGGFLFLFIGAITSAVDSRHDATDVIRAEITASSPTAASITHRTLEYSHRMLRAATECAACSIRPVRGVLTSGTLSTHLRCVHGTAAPARGRPIGRRRRRVDPAAREYSEYSHGYSEYSHGVL